MNQSNRNQQTPGEQGLTQYKLDWIVRSPKDFLKPNQNRHNIDIFQPFDCPSSNHYRSTPANPRSHIFPNISLSNMVTRIHASLTIALLTSSTGSVSGFSASSALHQRRTALASLEREELASTTALSALAIDPENEADAYALMLRARECANSDSCSIDEAEDYLREVVHIQGSCVAGNLAGQQLCEDIQFASEVISGLRNKIENKR